MQKRRRKEIDTNRIRQFERSLEEIFNIKFSVYRLVNFRQ